MSISVTKVDSPETRLRSALINITQLNSTLYPAVTTKQISYADTALGSTNTNGLTAYYIYDQWALKTYSVAP
jgi:hypothetical protein